ncbi:MAG TPA: hypothetical protein P5348_08390, partial [Bacteroidales bacterium]|nr:hypothetical protein [Bacteroidales bacterium]
MSKKKKKDKKEKTASSEYQALVKEFLSRHAGQSYNYKQIAKKLNIEGEHRRKELLQCLSDLAGRGEILETRHHKFYVKETGGGTITGTVDLTRMGYGF